MIYKSTCMLALGIASVSNVANASHEVLELCTGDRCSGYRGKQNKSVSGRTCQAWASQSPHKHTVDPRKYPDVGIEGSGNNFCRNTDASKYSKLHGTSTTIWCYTSDSKKRWEYCVPLRVSAEVHAPKKDLL